MNRRLLTLTVLVALVLTSITTVNVAQGHTDAGTSSEALAATASIGVRLDLEKLKVVAKNESSADEPFLWVVYIKVDGSTVTISDLAHSSATVHAPSGSHGDLGSASDDMEKGESVNIPDAIGRWDTPLSTINGLPDSLANDLSLVSVLVVAVEEDGTKDSAAEEGRKALVKTLKSELNKAIQAGVKPNIAQLGEQAKNAVVDAVKSASVSAFSFMPISSLLDIGGIVDPDDFVGWGLAGPFTLGEIKTAGSNGKSFALTLTGKDASEGKYEVTGRVRRTDNPSTFSGVFSPGKGGQHFVAGLDFQGLVDFWGKLGKQNPPVDMIDVETYVENGQRKYAGVFSPGKGGQHFVSGMDFQSFVDLWTKLGKQNPPVDLIDMEVYVENGQAKFAGIFSPGKGGQYLIAGVEFQPFVDFWLKVGKENPPADLVAVETYIEGGKRKYAGVFSPGKGGQHFVSGMDFQSFVDLWTKLGKQNPPVDMIDVETYVENGQTKYAGVFSPGKGGQYFVAGVEFQPYVDFWVKVGKGNPPADMIGLSVR
jgi:hypothetical protein